MSAGWASVMDRVLLLLEVSSVALTLPLDFSLSFERIRISRTGPVPEACLYHCKLVIVVL